MLFAALAETPEFESPLLAGEEGGGRGTLPNFLPPAILLRPPPALAIEFKGACVPRKAKKPAPAAGEAAAKRSLHPGERREGEGVKFESPSPGASPSGEKEARGEFPFSEVRWG